MWCYVTALLSMLYLTAVSSGADFHSPLLGIGHVMSTTSQGKLGKMSDSRVLRQTDTFTVRQCSQVIYRTQCTSSYAQDYINTISKCFIFGISATTIVEKLCRQNTNGGYCGTVGVDAATFLGVQQSCSSFCSSSCRSGIVALKNQHGCCLNENPVLPFLSSYFRSCGVSFPSACPRTSLILPSNTNSQTGSCNSQADFIRTSYNFVCVRQNIQPTLDALRSNNCDKFVQLNELGCSYRNGKYCFEDLISSSTSSNTVTALADALQSCPSSSSSCTSSCRSSLTSLNNKLGCCLNLYNASLQVFNTIGGTGLSAYSAITDDTVWRGCGITPPGLCQVKLTNAAYSLRLIQVQLLFLIIAMLTLNLILM